MVQGFCVCVIHFSSFFRHDLFENIVYTIQHFASAAEIFKQQNFSEEAARVLGECIIFFKEQLGFGLPEPVNALFYVTNHENIGTVGFMP